MIYEYKKYKDIDDFIFNRPKSKKSERYTIVHKCRGITMKNHTLTEHCFACLFCAANNNEQLEELLRIRGNDFITKIAENSFKGKPTPAPKPIKGLRHPYASLESFTGVDETSNIQPWAAGLLDVMSSDVSRVSMEIPVFNNDYDRNGRLDIGVIVNGHFLAVESKISLDDALKDERFIEQHIKYTVEIEKSTQDYVYLTLFGGKETDMFPPNSLYCTGKIGDKTQRFYDMICNNQIQFITANALWCLCCKYLKFGKQYCWDQILRDIFSDSECIGLISAGKVMKTDDDYSVVSL